MAINETRKHHLTAKVHLTGIRAGIRLDAGVVTHIHYSVFADGNSFNPGASSIHCINLAIYKDDVGWRVGMIATNHKQIQIANQNRSQEYS